MLLGINGLKGSGKNTAAEFLEEWCGDTFVARSQGLADALKVSAFTSLGIDVGNLKEILKFADWVKSDAQIKLTIFRGRDEFSRGRNFDNRPGKTESKLEYTIDGRGFLQLYGTESHRDIFGDSFWIGHLLPTDKKHLYAKWYTVDEVGNYSLTQLMMVTDVRFPNEAERVKELDGFVIKIRRPEIGDGEEDSHVSEKPLPAHLIDEVIVNDSSLEDLRIKMFAFGARRLLDGLQSGSGRFD
jgi:hypothetical protein